MVIRILLLVLLLSSCRSGEILCPEPKTAKLRKRPGNYGYNQQPDKDLQASSKQLSKDKNFKFPQARVTKSSNNIEEWDCPKPGSKAMPKSVRENIKKNRKKFDEYYKNRIPADSVSSSSR